MLATIFIEDVRAEAPDPFDPAGVVLAGLGIGGLVFGGSMLGLNFLPPAVVVALIGGGAVATYAYVLHARRTPAPVLDLSLLAHSDHAGGDRRRLRLPLRHRGDAVPAAAAAAARLRSHRLPVRA